MSRYGGQRFAFCILRFAFRVPRFAFRVSRFVFNGWNLCGLGFLLTSLYHRKVLYELGRRAPGRAGDRNGMELNIVM